MESVINHHNTIFSAFQFILLKIWYWKHL